MAWTPLAQRLAGRPHVLAGPILRAVTPTSVSVWFVLRTPAQVHLANQRAALIGGQAKMTTVAKSSHLITFGEYLLMYVFVWSNALWDAGLPAYTDLPASSRPTKASAAKKHFAEFARFELDLT